MKCPKCHRNTAYKYGRRPVFYRGRKRMVQAFQCGHCGHQWREK